MLPTPSTSHVDFERIYEPAEDSYLLLDTLSSESEKAFLQTRFPSSPPTSKSSSEPNTNSPLVNASHAPLILEIGTGSGVVLSFIHANACTIFGHPHILTMGIDVNLHACKATAQTISVAEKEISNPTASPHLELQHGFYLGNILSDLTTSLRPGEVDVLVFNPPYVPTATLPSLDSLSPSQPDRTNQANGPELTEYEKDSHLLELSYAGGADGMETTDRLLDSLPRILSERGCAYVLLCAQNRPLEVVERVRAWEGGEVWAWRAEIAGTSGRKAGWEKLVVVRIWRQMIL